MQLLGKRFQPRGDLRDLLHAAFRGALGGAGQELEIVDDDEAEAPLALQPPRAGGELGDGDAAGLVDIKRQMLQLLGDLDDAVELVGIDAAAADALGRNIGLLGDDAGGELLGRHFEREEADHGAVERGLGVAARAIGLGHVIGDVGGERRLAHGGTSGDDDQVGGLQAAHLLVEIGEAGGETRQAAVAPIGVGGHVDGVGQRGGERLEARAVFAGLGQLVKLLLGAFDLHRWRRVDRRIEGGVDHHLADLDELAADGEVVDGAAVILGIDDGGGVGGKPAEILRHGKLAHRRIGLEEGLERDRRGALAAQDQLRRRLEDARVQRVIEMRRLEEGRDAVDRLVVDEDRAEQRLLGLEIMRRLAKHRCFRGNLANQCVAHAATLPQSRRADSCQVCGQWGERALAHKERGRAQIHA